MDTHNRTRTLPFQLILGFIVVVVLTAGIIGLPAIWLIRAQLEYQAWSQVDQGAQAAQALYLARQKEMDNFAVITSQRPTFHDLLFEQDWLALESYLRTLQTGADLDLIAVCGVNQEITVAPNLLSEHSPCNILVEGGFHHLPGSENQQLWLTSSHAIEGMDELNTKVIVGLLLDDGFAADMHAQTGLEHTIWSAGQPVSSSLAMGIQQLASIEYQTVASQPPQPRRIYRSTQQYYATRFDLSEAENIQAEVSLGISAITQTQTRLAWILSGGILAVTAVVSILGVLLARQISQPLVQLADSAIEFSRGNLESTISVTTRVYEVSQVAQALENARVDLLETMTRLRRERDWGDHLLASIVEGIMILDDANRITYFSHGAERITGWSRDEVIGEPCDQVFQLAESDEPFTKSLPAQGQRQKIAVTLAGGRFATLAITGAQLAPSDVRDAQVVLVFRDISEEEALHRLMGHFLANVAHEFRTPLSALAASIELLLDQAQELSATEIQELLTSLHLGIVGLRTLVDNLLESASIEAGRFRVSPRQSDLGKIIAEAAQIMQPLLDKYNQYLTVELPTNIPVVNADARRIVQVIVNLLSNANKYGPSDAEIAIRANIRGDWVRVEVIDRGPGIQKGYQDDIFLRFVHQDLPDESARMGAGLGLFVVKAIVEAHDGQVGVENRPGGGSIFWFTLPRGSVMR